MRFAVPRLLFFLPCIEAKTIRSLQPPKKLTIQYGTEQLEMLKKLDAISDCVCGCVEEARVVSGEKKFGLIGWLCGAAMARRCPQAVCVRVDEIRPLLLPCSSTTPLHTSPRALPVFGQSLLHWMFVPCMRVCRMASTLLQSCEIMFEGLGKCSYGCIAPNWALVAERVISPLCLRHLAVLFCFSSSACYPCAHFHFGRVCLVSFLSMNRVLSVCLLVTCRRQ